MSSAAAPNVIPIIDPRRCEGKSDCVRVCPCNVFEVRALTAPEKQALPLWVRLKVAVHGGRQGFTVRAADCNGCALCVAACPEKAIKLRPPTP